MMAPNGMCISIDVNWYAHNRCAEEARADGRDVQVVHLALK
jgi:hypothetical protein